MSVHGDPLRHRGLVAEDKDQRVTNFHRSTMRALSEMIAAAGLEHPAQSRPPSGGARRRRRNPLVPPSSTSSLSRGNSSRESASGPSTLMPGIWPVLTASISPRRKPGPPLRLLVAGELGRRFVVVGIGRVAEKSADDRSCVLLDLAQMVGAAEAFRIDLVQRLGA